MIKDDFVLIPNTQKNKEIYPNYIIESTGFLKIKVCDLKPNAAYKITYICDSCGAEGIISYAKYLKRKDASKCKSCCSSARKDISFIRNEFSKKGYVLTTPEYINAHQPLSYFCTKHPNILQTIIYNSLQRGSGCFYCGLEQRGDKRKLTIEHVKTLLVSRGYEYISCNIEAGSKSKVFFKCPTHPDKIQEITYNNLQQSIAGCKDCISEARKGKLNILYRGETVYPSQYVRSYLLAWKENVLKNSKYVCCLSNLYASDNFDIHHVEPSNKYLNKMLEDAGYYKVRGKEIIIPHEAMQEIIDNYIDIHGDIEGRLLWHPIHKLYHAFYGYKDRCNTKTFDEFRSDFQKGWIVFPEDYIYDKPKNRKRNKSTSDIRYTPTPNLDQPREGNEGGYREAA